MLKRLQIENNCSTGNGNSPSCKNIDRKIDTLEKLNIDRNVEFAKEYNKCANGGDCKRFYYLDVTQRKLWNEEATSSFRKHPNEWTAVPDVQNKFHNYSSDGKRILVNQDGSYNNTKYIHQNGQMEIVVDKNGKIITDDTNAGTYNYYGPNPTFGNISEPIGHTIYDVAPYLDFGNSASDKTSYISRNPDNLTIKALQKIGNTKLDEKDVNKRNAVIENFKNKGK
uniref:hypothetical protein n=1 Tax=Psychrobacter sp. TaxID=56811 RepID=UPI00159B5E64|nr:hypothetical protein [Psychrobacter sp.]QJS05353.1 hypothetical protein [Psychrobacter sp.]QJS05434.1 hypothetical protein [Psychrobacter sp.]